MVPPGYRRVTRQTSKAASPGPLRMAFSGAAETSESEAARKAAGGRGKHGHDRIAHRLDDCAVFGGGDHLENLKVGEHAAKRRRVAYILMELGGVRGVNQRQFTGRRDICLRQSRRAQIGAGTRPRL